MSYGLSGYVSISRHANDYVTITGMLPEENTNQSINGDIFCQHPGDISQSFVTDSVTVQTQ